MHALQASLLSTFENLELHKANSVTRSLTTWHLSPKIYLKDSITSITIAEYFRQVYVLGYIKYVPWEKKY